MRQMKFLQGVREEFRQYRFTRLKQFTFIRESSDGLLHDRPMYPEGTHRI